MRFIAVDRGVDQIRRCISGNIKAAAAAIGHGAEGLAIWLESRQVTVDVGAGRAGDGITIGKKCTAVVVGDVANHPGVDQLDDGTCIVKATAVRVREVAADLALLERHDAAAIHPEAATLLVTRAPRSAGCVVVDAHLLAYDLPAIVIESAAPLNLRFVAVDIDIRKIDDRIACRPERTAAHASFVVIQLDAIARGACNRDQAAAGVAVETATIFGVVAGNLAVAVERDVPAVVVKTTTHAADVPRSIGAQSVVRQLHIGQRDQAIGLIAKPAAVPVVVARSQLIRIAQHLVTTYYGANCFDIPCVVIETASVAISLIIFNAPAAELHLAT